MRVRLNTVNEDGTATERILTMSSIMVIGRSDCNALTKDAHPAVKAMEWPMNPLELNTDEGDNVDEDAWGGFHVAMINHWPNWHTADEGHDALQEWMNASRNGRITHWKLFVLLTYNAVMMCISLERGMPQSKQQSKQQNQRTIVDGNDNWSINWLSVKFASKPVCEQSDAHERAGPKSHEWPLNKISQQVSTDTEEGAADTPFENGTQIT